MELLKDILLRVQEDFKSKSDVVLFTISKACEKYDYLKTPRTIRCILYLSKGELDKLNYFIEVATNDPRDVMLWAEYENEGQDEKPKRIRNFNKTFSKAETTDETNDETIEYISEDYYVSNSLFNWASKIILVFGLVFIIAPMLSPKKASYDISNLLFIIAMSFLNILYFMFKKHKIKLILNFETQNFHYIYQKYIIKNGEKIIEFSRLKSELSKKPTRSGAKVELILYDNKQEIIIVNEMDDNFDKNKLEEIHKKIQQINQDYC